MWFEPNQLGCLGGSVSRATALKAGGRVGSVKSYLNSLFSIKIEKRVLKVIALFALEV